jgi:hypothetical protein
VSKKKKIPLKRNITETAQLKKDRVTRVTRRQPGLKRFKVSGENLLLDHGNTTRINQVWVA